MVALKSTPLSESTANITIRDILVEGGLDWVGKYSVDKRYRAEVI